MAGEDGQQYVWGYVPVIVAKVGLYLKENAVDTEGVFRIAGSQKRMRELQETFDLPPRYGKDVDWTRYSIHDAASVLRRYLNQMPEPIIPLHLYNEFRNIMTTKPFDPTSAIRTYRLLITSSPPANQYLLLYVLDLLAVFARASDKNLMPASNLAVIFQPGMFSHPTHLNSSNEHKTAVAVLEFLIEHQDHFVLGLSKPPPVNVSLAELTVASRPTRPDEVYFEPSDSDEDLGVLEAHEGGGAALAKRSMSGRARTSSSTAGGKRRLFGRRGSKSAAPPTGGTEISASLSSPGLLQDRAAEEAAAKAEAEAKAAEAERVRTQVIEPRGLTASNASAAGSGSPRLSAEVGAGGRRGSTASSTTKLKRNKTLPSRRTQQEGGGLTVERSGSRGSRTSRGRKSAESHVKEEAQPANLNRTTTAEEPEEGATEQSKTSGGAAVVNPEKTATDLAEQEETTSTAPTRAEAVEPSGAADPTTTTSDEQSTAADLQQETEP